MLTKKQRDILTILTEYIEQHGIAPSFDELCPATGLKSKSGIHRLLSGLEERGYIRRLHNRARAVEILRCADGSPYVYKAMRKINARAAESHDENHSEDTQIPLLGKIAAGTPITAISNPTDHITIPDHMLGQGEHFALTIEGSSMVDAGILDGDTVIIQRAETAQNGDIVVALIDDEEATLKRLRRKGDSIALEPANEYHETRIFGPDHVRVQGLLVGLIRRY